MLNTQMSFNSVSKHLKLPEFQQRFMSPTRDFQSSTETNNSPQNQIRKIVFNPLP